MVSMKKTVITTGKARVVGYDSDVWWRCEVYWYMVVCGGGWLEPFTCMVSSSMFACDKKRKKGRRWWHPKRNKEAADQKEKKAGQERRKKLKDIAFFIRSQERTGVVSK
ncbi:hypothetical protein L1987_06377 [Smallanthus sonchifolius]|uniref:Uncharacterized protein n=1 Tax=Smallanthus sonchifolius TaxID=185202 RepID=A0ACB9JY02_9ASTR|nr:hypothetical protein L1987_06377 [Smallanthus sonchifolius]